jgi:predicted DCC family thiol-disulfide oxidoreductase YuxK
MTPPARVQYPLTVFYDASCPMCAGEMEAIKKLDADGRIILVDCSAPGFEDAALGQGGFCRTDAMTLIHARDADGRWLVGVDVFEAAYRAAGLTMIARFWGNRRMRPLLDRMYPWVARHRQRLSRLGLNLLVRLVMAAAIFRASASAARLPPP